MNILVSDKTSKYNDWLVVRSLQDVLSIVGNIEYLVLHKSKETSDDKIKYLTMISKERTSCKIVYVCNKDKVDNAIRMLITGGLDGKYVDDEFYLESERELNNLISDLPMYSECTELACSAVLMDFFNRYMSDGSKNISTGYLQVVKNAALEMSNAYHAKSTEILEMSESAADIFSSSIEIISQMKENQANLEKDLRTLKEAKENLDAFSIKPTVGSSIMFYPRVTYLKSKPIIKIKDLGNCPFLISFVLGFRVYLEKIKSVRPKLIIVESNGKFIEEKYKAFPWVTSANKNDSRNFYGEVTFTNCPTSLIMSRLLDDTNFDTFIVVDKTLNYKEHILNSKGSEIKTISGGSMIGKFRLSKHSCISSITPIEGTMFTIPLFENYPSRDDQRINKYLKECSTLYEILYSNKGK